MNNILIFLANYQAILTSLTILVAVIMAGWLVNQFFERVCRRFVGQTETDFDDKLVAMLRRPIYFSVLLSGIYLAVRPLSFTPGAFEILRKLLLTAGLIIWGITILGIVKLLFEEFHARVEEEHKEMLRDLIPFLENITRIIVGVIILLTILSLWGIDITPALASAGVVGIAVAFAARDTVANVFGGISVFFDRPYKSGDYVIVNGQYRGEVVQIGMRSTKIRTRDNVLLTVPNSVMVTNAVINETGFDEKLRIRIPLDIAYGTNLDKTEKVLLEVTREHKEILKKPSPRVRYRQLGESGIKLELLAVIAKPVYRGRITHELIKMIYERLRKEKIEIPYPQRDVHLYPASSSPAGSRATPTS